MDILNNPEYDEMLVTEIALQSDEFRDTTLNAIAQIDASQLTEEVWLGTLCTGEDNAQTQVKLVITRDPQHFVDED